MSWAALVILGAVTLQRGGELLWSFANTERLKSRGGIEVGGAHYPLMVLLHAAWLGGLWIAALDKPVDAMFLALYGLVEAGRLWVMLTLGRRWTTRIIVVPSEALVDVGPYKFVRHPNYLVVVAEIACLPLVFGLVAYAVLFSLANAAILAIRIGEEDRALRRSTLENGSASN